MGILNTIYAHTVITMWHSEIHFIENQVTTYKNLTQQNKHNILKRTYMISICSTTLQQQNNSQFDKLDTPGTTGKLSVF